MSKIFKLCSIYYNLIIKKIILGVFYGKYHTKQHFNLPSSRIILIFISQKIIGINRHVKFPVYMSNTIGRTGYLRIQQSSTISLAVNGEIYLQTINGINIGENTIIASGTKIISANHSKMNFDYHDEATPIFIGDNCWIGANSVILPSITMANNTIIGAGSIVSKSILTPNQVLVGNPAKCIKCIAR